MPNYPLGPLKNPNIKDPIIIEHANPVAKEESTNISKIKLDINKNKTSKSFIHYPIREK